MVLKIKSKSFFLCFSRGFSDILTIILSTFIPDVLAFKMK